MLPGNPQTLAQRPVILMLRTRSQDPTLSRVTTQAAPKATRADRAFTTTSECTFLRETVLLSAGCVSVRHRRASSIRRIWTSIFRAFSIQSVDLRVIVAGRCSRGTIIEIVIREVVSARYLLEHAQRLK